MTPGEYIGAEELADFHLDEVEQLGVVNKVALVQENDDLKGGVKKGAFDEATAQKKFEAWKADKQNGLNKIAEAEAKAKKDAAAAQLKAEKAQNEEQAKKDAAAKELAQEKKLNEEIAKKVAEKKAAAEAAKAEEEAAKAAEAAAAEAPAEEAPAAEAPAAEAPAAE